MISGTRPTPLSHAEREAFRASARAGFFIIALNKGASIHTSEEELTALASSPHPLLRASVARNFCCPPSLMRTLAEDDDVFVRAAVAGNAAAPTALLLTLWADENPSVSEAVSRTMAARPTDIY